MLVVNGVSQGRHAALLKKIVALLVGALVAFGSIIAARALSSKDLAAVDFISIPGAALASGWLAWRYLNTATSTGRLSEN